MKSPALVVHSASTLNRIEPEVTSARAGYAAIMQMLSTLHEERLKKTLTDSEPVRLLAKLVGQPVLPVR